MREDAHAAAFALVVANFRHDGTGKPLGNASVKF